MSNSVKGYQFTISGNTVTAVYKVEQGRVKLERMDSDEVWSFDGTDVIKTEWDDGRLESTIYTDRKGDGLFMKASKNYAETDASSWGGSNSHDNDWNDVDATLYGKQGYQFDLGANGAVTAVYEVKNGRVQAERIGLNETWTYDGLDVIQTEIRFGAVETSIYTDPNQDGLFQKNFDLEVLTGANPRTLETHKFNLVNGSKATGQSVVEGDSLTGMLELGSRGWKVDRLDANERLQVVTINEDNLILKTKAQWNGEIDFSVFRDDDNDGLWSEVAEGETLGAFVTQKGQVDLVGIVDAGFLQSADLLIA